MGDLLKGVQGETNRNERRSMDCEETTTASFSIFDVSIQKQP